MQITSVLQSFLNTAHFREQLCIERVPTLTREMWPLPAVTVTFLVFS